MSIVPAISGTMATAVATVAAADVSIIPGRLASSHVWPHLIQRFQSISGNSVTNVWPCLSLINYGSDPRGNAQILQPRLCFWCPRQDDEIQLGQQQDLRTQSCNYNYAIPLYDIFQASLIALCSNVWPFSSLIRYDFDSKAEDTTLHLKCCHTSCKTPPNLPWQSYVVVKDTLLEPRRFLV